MSKVFVSHSAQDRRFVEQEIVSALHDHGLGTWYSGEDIHSAEEWDRAILGGLRQCEWFLLVMSPNAAESQWVKHELHWAMVHRSGHVVPVLIEDCEPEEFHLGIPRIQYIDYRHPESKAREKLLAAFQAPGSLVVPGGDELTVTAPPATIPVHAPEYPFHCGPWVPPNFFVGREEELQAARHRIEAQQNFLIVGYPRAGKTSFCWKLIHELTSESDCKLLACYLNLEQGSQMTIAAFLEHTILNIIGEMARKVFGCRYSDLMRSDPAEVYPGLRHDGTFQSFVNIFRLVTRLTHHRSKSAPRQLLPYDFVRFTNELLEMSAEKGRTRFVIFYDEANRLPRDISVELLNNIGEALSQTGLIGCYAASPEMAEHFKELHGLLGGQIPLGPFGAIEDMQRLLARYYFNDELRTDELPVSAEAQTALWELSGGRPYLIQLIADRMFQTAASAHVARAGLPHVNGAYSAAKDERPEAFDVK